MVANCYQVGGIRLCRREGERGEDDWENDFEVSVNSGLAKTNKSFPE